MLYTVIVILMLIAAILMCGIVLIQNSKGGGLASSFSSSNAILGVKKTTDVLEKVTWTLAAVMVVLSIASAWALTSGSTTERDVIMEQAQKEETTNPYTIPAGTEAPASEEVPAN